METVANYKPNLEVVGDTGALASRCVELFAAAAREVLAQKDKCCIAISGGHTPRQFFQLLADDPGVKSLQWNKIHLFWVDERCVPPDSAYSNYKLAADTFLRAVPIPDENVHRIPTECDDFSLAAQMYEQTIQGVFGLKPGQLPRFDLIILGMGADGHTGSLFPDSFASFETKNLACVVYFLDQKLDDEPLNRITLTHPVLCAASRITVLVSGEEKARTLKEVLTAKPDEVRYPIHILWPVLDKVTWLVDADAAKLL